MKLKIAVAGALIAGFVIPAVAQAEEYYLVQDTKTKTCKIVEQKPSGGEWTMIGPDGSGL